MLIDRKLIFWKIFRYLVSHVEEIQRATLIGRDKYYDISEVNIEEAFIPSNHIHVNSHSLHIPATSRKN